MPSERLSKFLSTSGVASRRKCDDIIEAGHVKVNDVVVLQPFYRISVDQDKITVDNHTINSANKLIYIALNKPNQYLSDLVSERNRKDARSLISIKTYLFPVGRLDYNSEGLMLFTNDGDFANKVMHPKYEIEKEYFVKFKGILSDDVLSEMRKGLYIEGSMYQVTAINFIRTSFSNSWYNVVLKEGKNRMIRKIGRQIKHPVLKIQRIRIGPVKLGNLNPGEYRFLTDKEINYFLKQYATSMPKSKDKT
jgi:23S rRNA pseudouridine2605 synthase